MSAMQTGSSSVSVPQLVLFPGQGQRRRPAFDVQAFSRPARAFTGNFLIDDSFLYGEGVRDFDAYRVDPTKPLMPDFFVPADSVPPPAGARPFGYWNAATRSCSTATA